MINTLFSMHNIKYIISVDDCFFARKREDIEATIYSEMCTSLEPFRAILSSCNQTEIVDAIDEMMTVGADSTTLIQFLRSNEFCGISSILYYYAILQVCFTGQLVHN